MNKLILITVLFLVCTDILVAQNTFTVKVVDKLSFEPIGDAVVMHKGLRVTTNYMGYFQLTALPGDEVLLEHPMYESKSIEVPAQSKFIVVLDVKQDYLSFENGSDNFYNQIASQLRYPEKARSKKLQGTIFVQFTIDSLGGMTNLKLYGDEFNLFSNSIEGIFKRIKGHWNPKYVNKVFLLPIRYRHESMYLPASIFPESIAADRILNEIGVVGF